MKIKEIIRKKLNNKGMTMVNVLVAFAIFALILLMFQRAVSLSSKIFQTSEDIRKKTETLYSEFYEQTSYSNKSQTNDFSGSGEEKTYTFSTDNGSFSLDTFQGEFAADTGKVYFLGNRMLQKDGG